MQIGGCQELGGGRNEQNWLKGHSVSFRGDENDLGLDRGS